MAVVLNDGSGPWMAAWLRGATAQARAAHLTLEVSDARNSDPPQERNLRLAVDRRFDAAVVVGGLTHDLLPAMRHADRSGVALVAHRMMSEAALARAPSVILVRPDDAGLAQAVLEAMAAAHADGMTVGFIAPPRGYTDLDRRRPVWTAVRDAHHWSQTIISDQVANQISPDTAQDPGTVSLLRAALAEHADVSAVFAINELLAADVVTALARARLPVPPQVCAVGGDQIDPAAMTAPGSTWAMTALADPTQLGAACVRAAALRLAGELSAEPVIVPGLIITQTDLRQRGITTLDQLCAALPSLPGAPSVTVATAPWLPVAA